MRSISKMLNSSQLELFVIYFDIFDMKNDMTNIFDNYLP